MSRQMERSRWTDERLDDFTGSVTKSIDALRDEFREEFRGVRGDIAEFRAEVRGELRHANDRIDRLGDRIDRLLFVLLAGTIAIIATLIGFAG